MFKRLKSFFKNDGDNPLQALGMVIALGVIPVAIAAGIIGGAGWLLFLGAKAIMGATISSTAVIGTVAGGAALLLAGQYTGVNQALHRLFKQNVLRKNSDLNRQPASPPSAEWTKMIQERNAKNDFDAAAKKKITQPEEPQEKPSTTPKPPGNDGM